MARRVHNILVAVLLAVYGSASLLGPALHFLPGLHDAGIVASDPTQQLCKLRSADCETDASTHCPICQFLSQCASTAESPTVSGALQALAMTIGDSQSIATAPQYTPSNPRAPPFHLADIS